MLELTPAVTIIINGPDSETATLEMEGAPMPTELLGKRQQLDPGIYLFRATSGQRIASKRIALKRGKHRRVALTLPAEADDDPVPGQPPSPTMRYAGWSLVGVGAAGLLIGVISGAIVLGGEGDLLDQCGKDRTCPPQVKDDVQAFDAARNASTAGFVIAGAGAAIGTTLLLLAPKDAPAEQPDVAHVRPLFWPGGAGIWGTF